MQIYKKRAVFSNHDLLINHPFSNITLFKGCEKCNNFPSLEENYCGLCGKELYYDQD